MVTDDPQVRSLLDTGPEALNEVSRLLDQIKPTLPVLLANLTTVGQIAVTYHASLEQVLVLLPPFTAVIQSLVGNKNPTGMAESDFSITVNDPPACTVGFLPPSQWRSPADTTTIDTPDGLYCKLPQDSPIAVRGARNYPCMGHPGKRAPTVEICNSDKPFEPLAMRQHIFGTSRWIPTCSRRASRPTTGSASTATGSSDRWRERPGLRDRFHPQDRFRRREHRPAPQTQHRRRRPTHPKRCHRGYRPSRRLTFPTLHRLPPGPQAGGLMRLRVRSAATVLGLVHRWPSFITTRSPVGMSVRIGSCIGNPTSSARRRPKPGRTCFPRSWLWTSRERPFAVSDASSVERPAADPNRCKREHSQKTR